MTYSTDALKRAKAIPIAIDIIDEGATDLTATDIHKMSNADLFEWLALWGIEWTGREWLQQGIDDED